MKVRFALGLFRLWVVFGILWIAAVGAYTSVSYQNVPLRDLKGQPIIFDDLIPIYEDCWASGAKVDRGRFSDEALAQVVVCERTVDRWSVLKNGILIAFSIPVIALVLGWGFVWAFRGFLPAQNT
jgi:hypothetical protein